MSAGTGVEQPRSRPREALLQAKLAALVRGQWGSAVNGVLAPFPGGAGLLASPTGAGFVLVEGADHRCLGGALAWALRGQASSLDLLVETPVEVAGVVSRRATVFAIPITVWRVDGRTLAEMQPAPFSPPPAMPAFAARFADLLRGAGTDPVVELGTLTGEILGLEVARLMVDDAGPRLEVGVGRQDRLAQQALFPDRDLDDRLAGVVELVRRLRTAEAQPHLANTLSAERWLRAVVVAHPELVGAAYLAPVPPLVARANLGQAAAAPAAGVDRDGAPVVVACSIGIDLDLVPAAAEVRAADGRPGCRLILALPAGDDHPRTRQLAAALIDPAVVVSVPHGWKALAGSL